MVSLKATFIRILALDCRRELGDPTLLCVQFGFKEFRTIDT
jgi:hypothetical protein